MLARADVLQRSFHRAGIDRMAFLDAIRSMCPRAIRGIVPTQTRALRAAWSPDNPTRFCCYFVSEMVFWYCAPYGSRPMGVRVDGELHRYTLWPDGAIVDLTCDQFRDSTHVPYSCGRPVVYLQMSCKGPYKGPALRARRLAALIGKTEIIWKPMRPPLPLFEATQ